MPDADFVEEVAESVLAEDHRVDEELAPEILARSLLERLAVGAQLTATAAERVRTTGVRREVPAGMCRADPHVSSEQLAPRLEAVQRHHRLMEEDDALAVLTDEIYEAVGQLRAGGVTTQPPAVKMGWPRGRIPRNSLVELVS